MVALMRWSRGLAGETLDPRNLARQADLLQVVGLDSMFSCCPAQARALLGVLDEPNDRCNEPFGVKEIDQLAGFIGLDRFAYRFRIARHNGAPHTHRFEQTPAQHEGVGEVDVYGR